MRFLGGTVLFYVLGNCFDIQRPFHSHFFIFMMGVISVFIPISALSLIFYVVIFLELLHVSLEVTLFFALVVVLYFLVYQRVFPETRIYLMMVPIFFLFSTTCMFTDLCWDVWWNCRTSSDLNGNSDLLSVQYPSADNEPAGIRISHGKVYSLIAARAIDNKDLLLYFVVFCLVTALLAQQFASGEQRMDGIFQSLQEELYI